MESLFYCPVSARFSSSSFELYTPSDTPLRRFDGDDSLVRAALDELQLRVGAEIASASDAAFAAYAWQDSGAALVSRAPFSSEDLERITDELLLAARRPDVSGVRQSILSPKGHLVVLVDYQPVEASVTSEEQVEGVMEALAAIHDAGLVHGGLNERFLNPNAAPLRRVFGVGLSEAYAAWRRQQGLTLGDLRADPRFASSVELRGEAPTPATDAFSLAAVILCGSQTPGDPVPSMDPVQGMNALLAKAGQAETLRTFAKAIGSKRLRRTLEAMVDPPREMDPRVWRVATLAGIGLLALMLLWLVTRPAPEVTLPPPTQNLASAGAASCSGPGVTEVNGGCELAAGYGRCGLGTRLDESLGACVGAPPEDADTPAVEEEQGAEALPEGPHIHPVLTCEGDQRLTYARYSFSNSDINFTQNERYGFTRLAAQCKGPASVVYYTSNPALEPRANTIFDELRSSSICNDSCRESLPADPTAVVYVPYIGLIERSSSHYLFLHCCV